MADHHNYFRSSLGRTRNALASRSSVDTRTSVRPDSMSDHFCRLPIPAAAAAASCVSPSLVRIALIFSTSSGIPAL
jgi:hypothetical protein